MKSNKDIHTDEVDLHFSNIEKGLDKPLMVTAYFLRFIVNLKNSLNKERINSGKKVIIEKSSEICRLFRYKRIYFLVSPMIN